MEVDAIAPTVISVMLDLSSVSGELVFISTIEDKAWPYSAEYQLTRGRRLAAYDVIRLTIDTFTENDVADMLESGLMNKEDIVNGLLISDPVISPGTLPERIKGMARHPRFIPSLARMGLSLNSVLSHYKKYPKEFSPAAFDSWRQKKKVLFSHWLG